METGIAPVTERYAALQPEEFRQVLRKSWDAADQIITAVTLAVENESITPVQGAAVSACIVGQLFGYQEFHGETTPSGALLAGRQ